MKKMYKIITVISIIVMMSLCFCMNVYAVGLPSEHAGSQSLDRYITFTYNKEKKAYLPDATTDYLIVKAVNGAHQTIYQALYYNKDAKDGGQLQLYNGQIKGEYMICVTANSLETILEFADNPNKQPESGLSSDYIRNKISGISRTATYPDGAAQINAVENILYSSTEYIITQEFISGSAPNTRTMEEAKWITIKENRYVVNDPNGTTEEETKPEHGGGGATRPPSGNITDEEIKKEDVDSFFEKAINQLDKELKNNMFYEQIVEIINQIKAIFEEDYSRGQEGLNELGVFNMTLRTPYVEVSKDFGNEIIGSWEQSYKKYTSNIDYGINNMRTMNLDWFFGQQYSDGYYRKGVKVYTDALIGGFLWLMFIIYLWRNLPNLIAGEIGQITNKLEEVEDANYATETRNVTWETETGEIKRDRTTRTEKRKVRKRGD